MRAASRIACKPHKTRPAGGLVGNKCSAGVLWRCVWVRAGLPFSLSWRGVLGDEGETEVRSVCACACFNVCNCAFMCEACHTFLKLLDSL